MLQSHIVIRWGNWGTDTQRKDLENSLYKPMRKTSGKNPCILLTQTASTSGLAVFRTLRAWGSIVEVTWSAVLCYCNANKPTQHIPILQFYTCSIWDTKNWSYFCCVYPGCFWCLGLVEGVPFTFLKPHFPIAVERTRQWWWWRFSGIYSQCASCADFDTNVHPTTSSSQQALPSDFSWYTSLGHGD